MRAAEDLARYIVRAFCDADSVVVFDALIRLKQYNIKQLLYIT